MKNKISSSVWLLLAAFSWAPVVEISGLEGMICKTEIISTPDSPGFKNEVLEAVQLVKPDWTTNRTYVAGEAEILTDGETLKVHVIKDSECVEIESLGTPNSSRFCYKGHTICFIHENIDFGEECIAHSLNKLCGFGLKFEAIKDAFIDLNKKSLDFYVKYKDLERYNRKHQVFSNLHSVPGFLSVAKILDLTVYAYIRSKTENTYLQCPNPYMEFTNIITEANEFLTESGLLEE